VAEVLVQFADVVQDEKGHRYIARACGGEMPDSRWQGWIEFLPEDGGEPIRSRRETTQPNRVDTEYWATGLTDVYLEGALRRATSPARPPADPVIPPPMFDRPAGDDPTPATRESILNPFSVFRKGEALLRGQLAALSPWHLANIIEAHQLSDVSAETLTTLDSATLIEIIVRGVRDR
jgi:hypothetical protein